MILLLQYDWLIKIIRKSIRTTIIEQFQSVDKDVIGLKSGRICSSLKVHYHKTIVLACSINRITKRRHIVPMGLSSNKWVYMVKIPQVQTLLIHFTFDFLNMVYLSYLVCRLLHINVRFTHVHRKQQMWFLHKLRKRETFALFT